MTNSRDRRDDDALWAAIRAGDESAFVELVNRYKFKMLKTARACLRDSTAAEEVVQETWLAVVEGIRKFRHHSSLKTWLFGILINQTRKEAARRSKESPKPRRTLREDDDIIADWFEDVGEWRSRPRFWSSTPESDLLAEETVAYIYDVIAGLPEKQRIVITLREIEGWTSDEVCDQMKISRIDQRVLLHHARMKLKQMLYDYFGRRREPSSAAETGGSKP